MTFKERYRRMVQRIDERRSYVSQEHVVSEEKRRKKEKIDRMDAKNVKVTVREIINKKNKSKYLVSDLQYQNHTENSYVIGEWGRDKKCEILDHNVREIAVTEGDKQIILGFKKSNGTFQEIYSGKVEESGDCHRYFAFFNGDYILLPDSLDFTDTNAVRYAFRHDMEIAHFLDKFVIVTDEERKAYKKYAKARDAAQKGHKNEEESPQNVVINSDVYYVGHGVWSSLSPLKPDPQQPLMKGKSQRE